MSRIHHLRPEQGNSLFGEIPSDDDPFDFIKADGVARAVVEFGGAGRFVGCDPLSVFKGTAVAEIGGDACGSEGVAGDASWKAGCDRSAFNHAEDVGAMHAIFRQPARS